MKPAFQRPNILDLKHELETLDTSTNTYIHIISHIVPIKDKQFHVTLGMITQPHPNMSDSIELVEFQVGTTTHCHICSWKQRLCSTIILSVNREPITNNMDVKTAV